MVVRRLSSGGRPEIAFIRVTLEAEQSGYELVKAHGRQPNVGYGDAKTMRSKRWSSRGSLLGVLRDSDCALHLTKEHFAHMNGRAGRAGHARLRSKKDLLKRDHVKPRSSDAELEADLVMYQNQAQLRQLSMLPQPCRPKVAALVWGLETLSRIWQP